MRNFLFTSESVTEGHPDKICDQISDSILDAIIAQDPTARVACETTVTTGNVFIMGEISTKCYVDIPKIARQVILDIGYCLLYTSFTLFLSAFYHRSTLFHLVAAAWHFSPVQQFLS